jgi:hypothetical protein
VNGSALSRTSDAAAETSPANATPARRPAVTSRRGIRLRLLDRVRLIDTLAPARLSATTYKEGNRIASSRHDVPLQVY